VRLIHVQAGTSGRATGSGCGLFGRLSRYEIEEGGHAVRPIEVALIVTVAVGSQGLVAQSLGELARREAERRQATDTPSRVISDKDLAPSVSAALPAPPRATSAPDRTTNTPPEPKYVTRDASYWLGRMRELQTRRDYLKLQAATLEKRAGEIQADVRELRIADHRGAMQSERERLRTEHALVRSDLAATDKQIADLEDEARRSNVPPGWLRP